MSNFPSPPPSSEDRRFVLGQHLGVTVLTSAAETDGRHDVSDATLPAGAGTPLHLHTGYEERIWVVSGSLTVWAGPDTFTLRSGDFYTIATNTPHTLKAGDDGARTLNITSPARFAELIARTGTPAHLATADTEWDMGLFSAVAQELGDIILGPPGATPADLPADLELPAR
ncbi:cupin domain-containing protein [Streptomyces sp. NPDC049954]|uniref:cupin domain-containing protein n=1 Tax=Streptomyces sp. NPDC049954 TaxID=3155779 RepID=UPI003443697F